MSYTVVSHASSTDLAVMNELVKCENEFLRHDGSDIRLTEINHVGGRRGSYQVDAIDLYTKDILQNYLGFVRCGYCGEIDLLYGSDNEYCGKCERGLT